MGINGCTDVWLGRQMLVTNFCQEFFNWGQNLYQMVNVQMVQMVNVQMVHMVNVQTNIYRMTLNDFSKSRRSWKMRYCLNAVEKKIILHEDFVTHDVFLLPRK